MDFASLISLAAPFLQVLDLLPFGLVWFLVKVTIIPAYALWLFYLAVMNLKRARDNGGLTGFAYALAYPILFVGLALDFFVTIVFGTILFLDLPREGTLTSRLKRYVRTPNTWRSNLSILIAFHLLDRFDPAGWHVVEIAQEAPSGSPAAEIARAQFLSH